MVIAPALAGAWHPREWVLFFDFELLKVCSVKNNTK